MYIRAGYVDDDREFLGEAGEVDADDLKLLVHYNAASSRSSVACRISSLFPDWRDLISAVRVVRYADGSDIFLPGPPFRLERSSFI